MYGERRPKEIREYLTTAGRSPFDKWLRSLTDIRARAKVRVRIDRLSLGNLGDCKPVGSGYKNYALISALAIVFISDKMAHV